MSTQDTNAVPATKKPRAPRKPKTTPAVGAALIAAAEQARPDVLAQLRQAQADNALVNAKIARDLNPVEYVCSLLGACAEPLETRQQIARNIANSAMFGYIYANAPEREQAGARATALADMAAMDLSFLAPVGTEQLDLSATREHRSEYYLWALSCAYDEATRLAKEVMAQPMYGMPMQLQDVAVLVLQSAGTSSMDDLRNQAIQALLTPKQRESMRLIQEAEAATERSKWQAVLPALLRNMFDVINGAVNPKPVNAHPAVELRMLQKLDERLMQAADKAALGLAKVGKQGIGELYARIAALNAVQAEIDPVRGKPLVDRACDLQPELADLRNELIARGMF